MLNVESMEQYFFMLSLRDTLFTLSFASMIVKYFIGLWYLSNFDKEKAKARLVLCLKIALACIFKTTVGQSVYREKR